MAIGLVDIAGILRVGPVGGIARSPPNLQWMVTVTQGEEQQHMAIRYLYGQLNDDNLISFKIGHLTWSNQVPTMWTCLWLIVLLCVSELDGFVGFGVC